MRLEVVGTRSWHARGEGAPVRNALENRFPAPRQLPLSLARAVKSFDRKRLTSHKQSVPAKNAVHFLFGLNISVIKISWVM